MNKVIQMRQLWHDLASNEAITVHMKKKNGKQLNIGFINQYARHKFIPNKWFDWENRVNAEVMVIGQDWGPYKALLPYIKSYEQEKESPKFSHKEYLFRTFSSRTEKFIVRSIEKSFLETFKENMPKEMWNRFIFTVAIFFTRQGIRFRGSEFYDEKFGIKHSLPYLKRQIEIVKPKVIIPLGGTAWNMVREIFQLNHYPEKITELIHTLRRKPIKIEKSMVIPNFHPASHTDPKIQYGIWKMMWGYI